MLGSPSQATSTPLSAPITAPAPTAASTDDAERQPGGGEQAGDDGAHAELRADGDVDLPA